MKLGLPFTACLLALPLSALAQDLAISGKAAFDGYGGRMADPRAVGAGVDFDW